MYPEFSGKFPLVKYFKVKIFLCKLLKCYKEYAATFLNSAKLAAEIVIFVISYKIVCKFF